MMKFKNIVLFLLIFQVSINLNAQTKNEVETRINREYFPAKGLELLKYLPENTKRIKYYKESDNDKTSFEAKLKINKRKYSIEFDERGNLEDIEIVVNPNKMNQKILKTIESYFDDNFTKHRFLKIQKQFKKESLSSDKAVLKLAIDNLVETETNYEIIVQVNKDSKKEIKEFTFDKTGTVLLVRTVQSSSYEHVLY